MTSLYSHGIILVYFSGLSNRIIRKNIYDSHDIVLVFSLVEKKKNI